MTPTPASKRNGSGSLTLALDASTLDGSVAVIRDDVVLAERTVAMRGDDEERLMPAVADAIHDAGATVGELARVVCGAGPGSFTSLRIAASIAKGIAVATGAELYAVSSLELAAVEALAGGMGEGGNGRVVVALDAMRGDAFVGAYEWDGRELHWLQASGIRRRDELDAFAASLGAVASAGRPHARAVARIMARILGDAPVDLAAWEPEYGRKAEAQVRWEAAHGRPLGP